jgi:hypothetical protein
MNIEFLNLLKPPLEGDHGKYRKNRGNETIWVIIHICIKNATMKFPV